MPIGRHACVDCKTESPETELDYALTLRMSGWRDQQLKDAAGNQVVEWRCPACWSKHKKRTHAQTQFNLVIKRKD